MPSTKAFHVVSQTLVQLWHSRNYMLDIHLTTGEATNKDDSLPEF